MCSYTDNNINHEIHSLTDAPFLYADTKLTLTPTMTLTLDMDKDHYSSPSLALSVAMPVQHELRRLFHLMNIQTHQNSTQKALFLGAYFNS